jgi:hypothetical protein
MDMEIEPGPTAIEWAAGYHIWTRDHLGAAFNIGTAITIPVTALVMYGLSGLPMSRAGCDPLDSAAGRVRS